jgi:excisionase family DNA binding protein
MKQPKTISIKEAAELLRISKCTAYKIARSGQLPIVMIGRRRFISRPALMRMLNEAGQVQAESDI